MKRFGTSTTRGDRERLFDFLTRRSLFLRTLGTAAPLLLPKGLSRGLLAQSNPSAPEFHFEPQYKEKTAFDTAALQVTPGHDAFRNEPIHDRIAQELDRLSASLRQSPPDVGMLGRLLGANFQGTSWEPATRMPARPPTAALSVERLYFGDKTDTRAEAFLTQWRASLSELLTEPAQILTAEFQITALHLEAGVVITQVRAEIVGSGARFHREQRVGEWVLHWSPTATGYEIVRWLMKDEVRSRAAKPIFADITQHAFGRNSCYTEQLLHGADYWRTVLDGASGIDIYGHHGVSVGDINGDGFDDLYICQPAGLPNRLFRNRGDGTFEDVTAHSGVGILENTACALFADFNNNGKQDLVVIRANGPLLFLNQGDGKFVLKPNAFQFATPPAGTFTGAAAADYNRDGRLDIYFCLYSYYQGTDQYRYPTPYFDAENGPPNFLMHNNGDGTFRDVTAQTGLDKNNTRYSFCCGWGDANGDGWPDLYVVNDFGRKNLYRNNGDGTFRDIAEEVHVEDVGAGMSVCWLDYNNDGAEDLYVANMWTSAGERISGDDAFQKQASQAIQTMYRKHAMGNSLLKNSGAGSFQDVTTQTRTGMGRWAWSSDAWDFDHDGFADLYITNGMVSGAKRTSPDLNSYFWRQVISQSPTTRKANAAYEQGWNAINELIRADFSWSGYERNVFYANNGDGTFSDVSGTIGLDFIEDGRSFAVADFDHDGRQELLVKNRNAPQIRLMKNAIADLPAAISFRLSGVMSNRDAVGAAVTVTTGALRQTKSVQAGSGFLSQHGKELLFGLGAANGHVTASIRWPNGQVQELTDLPPGHRVAVTEASASHNIEPFKPNVSIPSSTVTASGETLPSSVETWLLVPIEAPGFTIGDFRLASKRGKPVLLSFWASLAPGAKQHLQVLESHHQTWRQGGLDVVALNVDEAAEKPAFPMLTASEDVTVTYSLLFRYLFDRHRDLQIPVSFLIDSKGLIVKVYQGPINADSVGKDFRAFPSNDSQRLARALPFAGTNATYDFGRNYLSLGSVFYQRGYPESAAGFFEAAHRQDPESAEALYGLGSVSLKQQNLTEARRQFEQAAQAKASFPETVANTWNNLGLIAAREGDTAQAAGYFEKSLVVDPDHLVSLVNLASAYRQQKRWDDAQKVLEHALAVGPDDAEAHYGLAMVYAQANRSDETYQQLQGALATRPDYPEALNNLGILYLRTRRRDQAVATFENCIRVAPAFEQAYLNLARVYAIEGNREKARATVEALLVQHPGSAAAKEMMSQLQ